MNAPYVTAASLHDFLTSKEHADGVTIWGNYETLAARFIFDLAALARVAMNHANELSLWGYSAHVRLATAASLLRQSIFSAVKAAQARAGKETVALPPIY